MTSSMMIVGSLNGEMKKCLQKDGVQKKKKGIINALNKKKRPVVAQIHNTERKVKVWILKLATTKRLSMWKLHDEMKKSLQKKKNDNN